MSLATIKIRSGGIIIEYKDPSIIGVLTPVINELKETELRRDWKTKKYQELFKADWFMHNTTHRIIRFHSQFADKVLNYLRTHPKFGTFTIIKEDPIPPRMVNIKYRYDHKPPRPRQKDYIQFMINPVRHIRVLPASMGVGKTLCTINAITLAAVRAMIVIQPNLKDNWINSIKENTYLTDDDILYVSGSKDLGLFMEAVASGNDPWPIVIFSCNTLDRFIKGYLDDDWMYTPEELFDNAQFGIKVVDEAHKWLKFHSYLDTFSNIRNHLFLTATIMRESPFLKMMEDTLYPMEDRCKVDPPKKYIDIISYQYDYRDRPPGYMGAMGYHHIKYENNIYGNKVLRKQYIRMVATILYSDYIRSKKPGDRAMVFFSTTNMVTAFMEFVKQYLPDINVVSYLQGDDEDKYESADLIVSTVMKSGTGLDVANLTFVLQTIMIASKGENFQNAGRLREIKGKATKFAYIWCSQIDKHRQYHKKRIEDLNLLASTVRQKIYHRLV